MEEHRKEAEKSESRPYTRSSKSLAASEIHKSVITDHVVMDNHVIDWDNIRVLDREEDRTRRWIKGHVQGMTVKLRPCLRFRAVSGGKPPAGKGVVGLLS